MLLKILTWNLHVQVFKNIIKYLLLRCPESRFKHDFESIKSPGISFSTISTLEEQCSRLGGRGYTSNQELPQAHENMHLFCSLCRMWECRERTREIPILIHGKYNSTPMSSWYQSNICMLLSLFIKRFHVVQLILKIIP